jgi:N-acetylmuramoyl-L-alanine amidase
LLLSRAVQRRSVTMILRVVLALALLSSSAARAQADADAPKKPQGSPLVVVIDPGHGGAFPHDGAHGVKGLIEKNITLEVGRRLRADLEAAGATVLMTREDDADVTLADRARFANEASADLFVSIHCNSMATRHDRALARGVESYFLSPDPTDAEAKMLAELENGGPAGVPLPKAADAVSGLLADLALGQARNDSAQLAETLHRALILGTGAQSRGVRQAPFLVLSGTKMPSALIEIGFISHASEGKALAKEAYQQRIAAALAQGVRDFASQVLLRRLLPATEEARAALLARRAEAAQERDSHRKKAPPNPLASQSSVSQPLVRQPSLSNPPPAIQSPDSQTQAAADPTTAEALPPNAPRAGEAFAEKPATVQVLSPTAIGISAPSVMTPQSASIVKPEAPNVTSSSSPGIGRAPPATDVPAANGTAPANAP